MANIVSNHAKYQFLIGAINCSSDVFKIRLAATGYTYDEDAHATWADVSANELADGNGYTSGGSTLAGVSVTEDDPNNRGAVTWTDATWTASGGSIGPSPGAWVIDDTTADDTILHYIDFGSDQTATDNGTFAVENIYFRLT